MKKLLSLSIIAATIGVPTVAMAQTMPNIPSSVPAGTAVCRPAKAGETANASMGSTPMMCRSVNVAKVNAAIKQLKTMMAQRQANGASSTPATTQQMLQAQAQLNSEMIPPVIPGGNGGIEE